MSFLDELAWRGLLHQRTAGDELDTHLAATPRVGYCGFDPTSDSLHIGSLIPIQLLRHWQLAGHKPIVVMGGGTGLIGDPSGKDDERPLLARDQIEANIASQKRIFQRLLDFDPAAPNAAVIVNNIEWLGPLGFIEVMRDVGKHFSVNAMIQRDSVRQRLQTREHGISYTEFSYMILQAYDFLHLRRVMNCTVQLAGSDQYGNIVAGVDLIRREFGQEQGQAFGITAPLVLTSQGKKMGKTEQGPVWLTADRTSPYAFHQYWINLPDADVVGSLKWFTMRSREEIDELAQRHEQSPQLRLGQRALASDLTELLRGRDELRRIEDATAALFGAGDVRRLDEATLADVFADVPHSTHTRSLLEDQGIPIAEILPQTSLAESKREAREFLNNGAVSVNGEKAGIDRALTAADLLHGRTILLRRGKKHWHATEWV